MKRILLLILMTVCYLSANIGKISAINGNIIILRNAVEIKAKKNDTIENKDIVKSIGNSKAQIIFLDKTIITIGKNTILDIEEYLFDDSIKSTANFRVPIGIFKTITGKIAKIAKKKFILKTSNATIGIRGTHFTGNITKEDEQIACLKGSIIVTVQGKSIDILEGEMINIKAGLAPSVPKKYKAVDIKNINSFSNAKVDIEVKKLVEKAIKTIDVMAADVMNQEMQDEIYDKINTVKNLNDKAASYNMYIDLAMEEAYKQLDSQFFEVEMDDFSVNQYQDLFDDTYEPLSFTYFTKDEPKSGSINDILAATPFQDWRHEENTPRTPEDKIIEYMGGINPFTQEIYPHWDGRAEGRKISIFDGNIIGIVSNTLDYVDKVSFIDPQDNYSQVIIDFGNKLLYSYLTFNAPDPITNKVENWQLSVSSAHALNISSTGFYSMGDDFYELYGYKVFDATHISQGRFYGENLNQVSGGFSVGLNKTGESIDNHDVEDTRFIFAQFVANNSSEYDVIQIKAGEDEYFSWGDWNSGDPMGMLGTWIKPKIENTPLSVISEYIEQSKKYTYSGGVIGTYFRPIEFSPAEIMDGNFFFDMDFGAGTLEGSIYVEALKDNFHIGFLDGKIDNKGFSGGRYLHEATKDIKSLDMTGQFFGNDAQQIGGGFRFETTNGDIGLGSFIGTKEK